MRRKAINTLLLEIYDDESNYEELKKFSYTELQQIASLIFEKLQESVENRELIMIPGFGSFYVKDPLIPEKKNFLGTGVSCKKRARVLFRSFFKIGDKNED